MSRWAVFIDKDGTLVENVPYNVDPARLRFTPNAFEGLRLLAAHGYQLIVVTNQPGLAYGMFSRADLMRLHAALAEQLQQAGAPLADFYCCPHAPAASKLGPGCLCRKPAPGLLRQAARRHALDLAQCWMVGDILDDIEAGARAGCRSVLLDVGNETEWRLSPLRTPHVRAADLLQAAQAIVAFDAQPAAGCEPRAAAGSPLPASMPARASGSSLHPSAMPQPLTRQPSIAQPSMPRPAMPSLAASGAALRRIAGPAWQLAVSRWHALEKAGRSRSEPA